MERTFANSGRSHPESDLVGLATPALELIMQLRAKLVKPSNNLRHTIDGMLRQMEQSAEALGYREAQVQSAKFALAAFADETVLTADFPLRDEWEKFALQLEYFGEQLAGEKFFERLDLLMKDGESNADVLEVYYICLLVGYKGKYTIYFEDQLKGVIQTVADCLRRFNRLRAVALSPHWRATDQPELATPEGIPGWVKIVGGGGLGLIIFSYLIFHFWLSNNLSDAIKDLLR